MCTIHFLSSPQNSSRWNWQRICSIYHSHIGNYQDTQVYVVRQKSTTPTIKPETGFIKKYIKKMGWLDYSKSKLMRSGYYLYESVADQVNYVIFFKEFKMPDTFFSWFLVTELHVWMLLVRVMAEGDEGRFVRNTIVEAMWADVTTRSKLMGAVNPSDVREQLQELSDQFQAAIIGYDEGLLTNDMVLAGAIWRRFFQMRWNSPEEIEYLVRYIRKQVKLLDELPREQVLVSPNILWSELQIGPFST